MYFNDIAGILSYLNWCHLSAFMLNIKNRSNSHEFCEFFQTWKICLSDRVIKESLGCKRSLSMSCCLLNRLQDYVIEDRIFAIGIDFSEFFLKRGKLGVKRPYFRRSEVVGSKFDFKNKWLIYSGLHIRINKRCFMK